MGERDCFFVTKDGRLTVFKGGVVRMEGKSPETGAPLRVSTYTNPETSIILGKDLKKHVKSVRDKGMSSTHRRSYQVGHVPGSGMQALEASVGPEDVLMVLTRNGPRGSTQEFPPPYTYDEVIELARAMIEAGKAEKDAE